MKLGVAWLVFVITAGETSPVARHRRRRPSQVVEKWQGVVMVEDDAHRSEEEMKQG
jgi:hypothetical protein